MDHDSWFEQSVDPWIKVWLRKMLLLQLLLWMARISTILVVDLNFENFPEKGLGKRSRSRDQISFRHVIYASFEISVRFECHVQCKVFYQIKSFVCFIQFLYHNFAELLSGPMA